MPLAKSKNKVGLGNALMNDRFGKGKGADRKRVSAVTRVNHATGEEYITNSKEDAAWVKMKSVTEQGALDEFLATAELAGTDFAAEKTNNYKIIHTDQRNPYLLSAAEERDVLGRHREHRARLTVPRRPRWDASTTPAQLDAMERESFLGWRRNLAELQENHDLLMTPFERNLEVWRQLWRVIERSDVVVQIVDARNPLMFRCEDLETYVKAVDPKKENLLLINKADMMTYSQRRAWASYLKGANVAFKFFSASLAGKSNESLEDESEEDAAEGSRTVGARVTEARGEGKTERDGDEAGDTNILTVDELEGIFLQYAPEDSDRDRKLEVGLVGYPNVGKSSTINSLIGAKKVSVSATPGKTKHFQTIHLSDRMVLCDCPGLVFPNFATTKADLVCNGVLPIDQLREYTGPVGLVTARIPKPFLDAVYGIQIRTRPIEEGGTGVPTAEEFLGAYARHRGFMTQGQGQPDRARAARYVLKDYVSGKLLYCEPPPGGNVDPREFNRELYDVSHLPAKRQLALAAAMETLSVSSDDDDDDGDDDDLPLDDDELPIPPPAGPKSERLDKAFFKAGAGNAGHLSRPFNHKYSEQGQAAAAAAAATSLSSSSGKQLSGRKMRTMVALETGVDPKDVKAMSGKKHFKGGQRGKGKKKTTDEDDD